MKQKSSSRGRVGAVARALGLCLVLGACSATPDWANPVEWYKGVEGWFGEDDEAARARERAKRPEMQAPGADQPFPRLATVPARPDSASMAERRHVQSALVADRERARYAELAPGDNAPSPEAAGAPPPPKIPSPEPRGRASESRPSVSPDAGSAQAPAPSSAAEAPGYREEPRVALIPPSTSDTAGRGARSRTLRTGPTAVPGPLAPSPEAERVGTVYFADGSSGVSEEGSTLLRKIAKMQNERGANLRVIGHASRRTRSVSPLRHRLANLRISMDRARAVAERLVRYGVPPDKVSVSAMSDNQPVYQEVMPSGEAGNRRAEIFLEY